VVEWTEYNLDELLLNDFDGAWGEEAENGDGVTVLRSTDMRGGKLSFHNAAKRKISPNVIKKKRLINGDILINKSSGSAHLVGASVLFFAHDDNDYLCSNFTRCLRPDQTRVDPEFLYFGLQSPQFHSQIFGAQRTTSGLRNLKISEFKAGTIPIPESLTEQRLIVVRIKECMERVEEIEGLRAEGIDEANAALPSILNETFIELITTYDKVEIGSVSLETRYGTSKKCTSAPTGTAILRIPNVARGFVNFNDLKYCALDIKERQKMVLEVGDLLFVRTNGSRDLVGRCAIYEGNGDDKDYGFASYLIRLRLDINKIRPHFLAFFLNSSRGRAELDRRRRTSAGQFNINSENLRNIEVPLPPMDVQDQIIESLSQRQARVIQLQDELRSVQEVESHLRESILRKAFAGEL